LKTGGFREDAQDHVAVADLYRFLVRSALSGLRSIERVTDVALRSDQKLDSPGSVWVVQKIAENQLVRPGHNFTGLVLVGWIDHPEVHAEGAGNQDLVFGLRASVGYGCILSIVDAGSRPGVFGVDAQPNHTGVVRAGLADDLNGGGLLAGLTRDVSVAEVLPESAVAGDGFEGIQTFGRQPRHTGLFGVTVGYVSPAGIVLIFRPEEVLCLIANRVEVLFDIEVELQGVCSERILHLVLPV